MVGGELHEILLDVTEKKYKRKGFITSRPYGKGSVLIDLLAYHPLTKESYCFDAITETNDLILFEKKKKYSPYGKVVFIVAKDAKRFEGYDYEMVDLGSTKIEGWMFQYEKMFSALGSKHRLKILGLTFKEERSYTSLKVSLGLIAGHFDYHLKLLLSIGFLEKVSKTGKYKTTSFGKSVLRTLKKIKISK